MPRDSTPSSASRFPSLHEPTPSAPRTGLTAAIDQESLSITFAFQCNLACTFCMVESGMGVWNGVSLDEFEAFARDEEQTEGLRRVIFSGGEVTLDDRLFDYVARARAIPSVEHVRIQTNGIRLAKGDYLARLVDAGVDEYFVSIHGHDPSTCDRITGKRGSFDAIVAGIAAVGRHPGALLITDTAVCSHNFDHLAEIVDVVAPHSPESMEFWCLWPQIDKDDERGLFVRVTDSAPHVVAAVSSCVDRGILPVVRSFPRCLLGKWAAYHYDLLPPTIIDAGYWEEAPEWDCVFRGVCTSGTRSAPGIIPLRRPKSIGRQQASDCLGLSAPYVRKFGWEEQALKPFLRPGTSGYRPHAATDFRAMVTGGAAPGSREKSVKSDDGGACPIDPIVDAAGLRSGVTLGVTEVRNVKRTSERVELLLAASGHESRVWLYPTTGARPCFTTVNGVDIVYQQGADADPTALSGALDALIGRLSASPS